jgi:hypothetical protein
MEEGESINLWEWLVMGWDGDAKKESLKTN